MNVENVSTSVASSLSLTPKARQPEPAAEAKAQTQVAESTKEEAASTETRKDSTRLVDISV
jgi:hypothetical protein